MTGLTSRLLCKKSEIIAFLKKCYNEGMKYHDYIWDLGWNLQDNYETSTAAFVKTLALYGIPQDHDECCLSGLKFLLILIETFIPTIF